jgi:hypothetical protein
MADDVERVWRKFNTDRKTARAFYAECFGRAVDDPGIDSELAELFAKRAGEGATVAVPIELVLALIMRPPPGKGRGKMRPELETCVQHQRL